MKGVGDIKITLYDIFGYLFPGLVALGGAAMLAWALLVPTHPLPWPIKLGSVGWFVVIVCAYVLGHLVQAVASDLSQRLAPPAEAALWGAEGTYALPERVVKRLEKLTHEATPTAVFEIADQAVTQYGATGDRDIYIYREGFYRGLVAAFWFVDVSLIVLWLRGHAAVKIGGVEHSLTAPVFIFALVVFSVAALLARRRWRRFTGLKIRNALLGYLVIAGVFGKLVAGKTGASADGE